MANWVHLGIDHEGNLNADLEIFHMLFSGQTNLSGKTTTIRTLVPRVVAEGYTVLIFDTKPTTREFEGYHDIPICYRSTTDSLVLIGLLESIRRARLSNLYATLTRLTEGAHDLTDVVKNAEEMEEHSRSGWVKDACHTLADLIHRLERELSGQALSPDLELRRGDINVMPINDLSVEAQQLVVKTAFELALKHRGLILVIDESWRFLPEQYSSACKKAIQDVVTQGAKTRLFVWLATQFLAPTDKNALKAMANKLIGRQDHPTEIRHSQDLIPDGKKAFPAKTLMKLRRGEFIFVPMDGETRKVYIDDPDLGREGSGGSAMPRPSGGAKGEGPEARAPATAAPRPDAHAGKADEARPDERSGLAEERGIGQPVEEVPTRPESVSISVEVPKVDLHVSKGSLRFDDDHKAHILYALHWMGKDCLPKDVVAFCLERGWHMEPHDFSNNVKPLMQLGLLLRDERQRYRLPSEVPVHVAER